MNEAWKVAALLEEMANQADPVGILRERTRKIAANLIAGPMPQMMISPDHENGRVEVTFFFPVETCMKGVEGTPDEVLEWLQTGLQPGQSVRLMMMNGPAFAVTQTHADALAVEDFDDLVKKYIATLDARAESQRQNREQEGQ